MASAPSVSTTVILSKIAGSAPVCTKIEFIERDPDGVDRSSTIEISDNNPNSSFTITSYGMNAANTYTIKLYDADGNDLAIKSGISPMISDWITSKARMYYTSSGSTLSGFSLSGVTGSTPVCTRVEVKEGDTVRLSGNITNNVVRGSLSGSMPSSHGTLTLYLYDSTGAVIGYFEGITAGAAP